MTDGKPNPSAATPGSGEIDAFLAAPPDDSTAALEDL
jgi:hypothetical protein